MRAEIARIQADLDVTTIYVTHDQVEAMTMGDRVAVLRKGELQQVGSPQELFAQPVNLFVAGFIGSPAMNFVSSPLKRSDGGADVSIGGQTLHITQDTLGKRGDLQRYFDKEVIVGIRPQDFEEATFAPSGDLGHLKARVDLVEALGTQTLVHFEVDAPPVQTEEMKELAADSGAAEVGRYEDQANGARAKFVGEVDPKVRVSRGDEIELVVDTTQLHFFDRDTGAGIYGG
jgi:multiple sugar transport system ATP-binding protein